MLKIISYIFILIFSMKSFAFFETGEEKVINFISANKGDDFLSDVFQSKYIPPYKSNKVYREAISLCRKGIFSDPYLLSISKSMMRDEFLGYAANAKTMFGGIVSNSGGINQLFNDVEYDFVMLNTYKNDKSGKKAADILFKKNQESPRSKKAAAWIEENVAKLKNKEDTPIMALFSCSQLEYTNTILKNGDGLFKEELNTVRFQVHNQDSGRTKTLLAN